MRENPTCGERGSQTVSEERGERIERKRERVREARTHWGEGKPRGLLKKFYLVGALRLLRRYRTPVRCCWPRCVAPASSWTSYEEREVWKREREKKEEGSIERKKGLDPFNRLCTIAYPFSGPDRSYLRH